MHFNLFIIDTGHHEASWRLPDSDPLANTDVDYYERLARTAEAAKFDSVFLADSPVLWNDPGRRPSGRLEPVTLLTALARATQRIGLIATASTSYNEPYNLARRFASLDHSAAAGPAGTSSPRPATTRPATSGSTQPAHAERYQRAAEFIEVSRKLWDSWEDDAVVADNGLRRARRADRVHAIEHAGKFFQVRGPLSVPRSPQGHPVLVQAGSSEDGKDFAARYAEAVFTAQQTLAEGQAFYADLKQRAAAAGRDPDGVKILPGIVPVLGSTEAEALELEAELDQLIVAEYARNARAPAAGATRSGSRWTSSCPPTCRPRTRSRGTRAGTR